jgi:hypothetical protein
MDISDSNYQINIQRLKGVAGAASPLNSYGAGGEEEESVSASI